MTKSVEEDLNKLRFSKFKKDIRSKIKTHNTKLLRSIENLPPRLNETYQYQRVLKLTPGQNQNSALSFFVLK